ncbi:DUF4169 family protein [Sulfitobacter aestuarii]|uniref:DUF4169 family protein n=1 Tax=Sulfitobacter aestuarii TaxID=2161676 RepID=A0ABW5U5L2_9RHOB
MSNPINLNKVKKERERQARRARADENSVSFGQSKAQKELLENRADQDARKLESHKREE